MILDDSLPRRLAEALGPLPLVEAWIFGSVAVWLSGGALNHEPNDVDVLLIATDPELDSTGDAVWRCVSPLSKLLGLDVHPIVLTVDQWADLDAPFVATVRARPLVSIPLVPHTT